MASRRQEQRTDESTASFTPSLVDAAATAESFLERSFAEIDISTPADSKTVLGRWLSIRSVISTASSFAIAQEEAASKSELQNFKSIGKGLCGEVFEQVGTGHVFKRGYTPHDGQLWNDLKCHTIIYGAITSAIRNSRFEMHVPRVYSYISRNNEDWWSENRARWPSIGLKEPTDLIETERILPLPRIVRRSLVQQFCPPHLREQALTDPLNRDCLIRLYLGRRAKYTPVEDFTLRNFEADLTIVDDLKLEKLDHARTMALALAALHWTTKLDACDVEFVLGSAPVKISLDETDMVSRLPARTDISVRHTFRKRSVHLWLLDFNRCETISMDMAGVAKAVHAFWSNDPYFPRPVPPQDSDALLWKAFEEQYLLQSTLYVNKEAAADQLPQKFIDGVISEAKKRHAARSGAPRGGGPLEAVAPLVEVAQVEADRNCRGQEVRQEVGALEEEAVVAALWA